MNPLKVYTLITYLALLICVPLQGMDLELVPPNAVAIKAPFNRPDVRPISPINSLTSPRAKRAKPLQAIAISRLIEPQPKVDQFSPGLSLMKQPHKKLRSFSFDEKTIEASQKGEPLFYVDGADADNCRTLNKRLYRAISYSNIKKVRKILKTKRACPNMLASVVNNTKSFAPDETLFTLAISCRLNAMSPIKKNKGLTIIKELVKNDADVNAKDSSTGTTGLMCAAMHNDLKLAKALIGEPLITMNILNLETTNLAGKTAYDLAIENNSSQVRDFLDQTRAEQKQQRGLYYGRKRQENLTIAIPSPQEKDILVLNPPSLLLHNS